MEKTLGQFRNVIEEAKKIFADKMEDYGPTWQVLRPMGILDQLCIKAKRIRTLQDTKENLVGEPIENEFIGILNYAVIGLILLKVGTQTKFTLSKEKALLLYSEEISSIHELLLKKNHDYGEAWREMSLIGIADQILIKILRSAEMTKNGGAKVSEGIDANYRDIVNYSVFALILIKENVEVSQPQ